MAGEESSFLIRQAEDRCHRIGQEQSLLVQYLYFQGTLDERLAAILNDKQGKIRSFYDPSRGRSTPRAELEEHLACARGNRTRAPSALDASSLCRVGASWCASRLN